MRSLSLIAAAAILGSCAVSLPGPPQRAASASTVAYLLGGKVPGAPMRCLQSFRTNDMTVIDGQTIAYRDGGYRTYLVHLSPGCEEIANGGALVTRSYGTSDTCTGDIAHVLSGGSRMMAGSCSVESIVPYTRPGR